MLANCRSASCVAHKPDNHSFDCVVGAATAGIHGTVLSGTQGENRRDRKPISLSEIRREKRA